MLSGDTPSITGERAPRSIRERLKATLGRNSEALSPRVLRRTLTELQAIVDPQLSEVGGRAPRERRCRLVCQSHARAAARLLAADERAVRARSRRSSRRRASSTRPRIGTPEEGQAEIRLRRAMVSPRTRLLQRFAVFPEGMRFLVRPARGTAAARSRATSGCCALDAELENLFSTWFDVAFLELRRISWDSPASLIEKLIKYEAVHDIRSWADVKNRLDSDRRCYGFFHPRLDDEPLIFVEVALMDEHRRLHHAAARRSGRCRSTRTRRPRRSSIRSAIRSRACAA